MGTHPLNLALRFVLEVTALASMGYWGWNRAGGGLQFVLALGVPTVAAILWGTFAVPDDPSRSGAAPVPVPGALRLLLELAFFAFAVWALYDAGATLLSWVLAITVAVHYALSYDRLRWLIKR